MYRIHVGTSNWKLKHWYSHNVEACNFGKLKSLFFPVACCMGAALKEENEDIDLVQFNLSFYVRKGLYHLKYTFGLHCLRVDY